MSGPAASPVKLKTTQPIRSQARNESASCASHPRQAVDRRAADRATSNRQLCQPRVAWCRDGLRLHPQARRCPKAAAVSSASTMSGRAFISIWTIYRAAGSAGPGAEALEQARRLARAERVHERRQGAIDRHHLRWQAVLKGHPSAFLFFGLDAWATEPLPRNVVRSNHKS